MVMLKFVAILLGATCWALDDSVAAEQQNQHQNARFTGLYRNESVSGRSETGRVTDGKTNIDVTEQEYRERGYAPPYESLRTRIVRRLPVRIPVPSDWKE
jgi:hypothetical protein